MAIKDQYDEALERFQEMLTQTGLAREGMPLLEVINRYHGELRRKNAALRARAEELEGKSRALESRLAPLAGLPGQLEELRKKERDLVKEKADLVRLVTDLEVKHKELVEHLKQSGPYLLSGESTFTSLKVKCLACGLHFILCTWFVERHSADSLHCPECGQQEGRFIVWREPGRGFIFQHVPGAAELIECCPQGSPRSQIDPQLHPSNN